MTDRFALCTHHTALGAEMTVSVNLELYSAVAENSLGHDGHRIHALNFGRDDERSRFVVRVGSPCANGGDKRIRAADQIAVPIVAAVKEWNHGVAARYGAIQHNVGIKAHKLPATIAVAIACSGSALLDVAKHRAGVATDYVVVRHETLRLCACSEWRLALDREWREFCVLEFRSRRGGRSRWLARSELQLAHQFLSRRTGR